ncbi:MAG: hypothetical protein KatS3mg112_1600 [Thermogutta sp.]|nr:MAG: hypothetical protein KatS3mg112_1600 [Thermogutta sp.]
MPLRFSGETCLSGPLFRRWIIRPFFSGTTSVPLRPFGGTRLSGPPSDVASSIAFRRGLKSRGESGAKAPHSIWSAAIHRRFLVKALAFTTLALAMFCHDHESALVGAIHELPLQRRRDPLCRGPVFGTPMDNPSPSTGHDKRAPPKNVGGTYVSGPFFRWINHATSSGTTSVPLRPFGGTRLSGPFFSEGRACHVRLSTWDLSISFHQGLKSRGESGAKAPHSTWAVRFFIAQAHPFPADFLRHHIHPVADSPSHEYVMREFAARTQ